MIFGIVLAFASALTYNVGLLLEKRALTDMPELSLRRIGSFVRTLIGSPAWLAGFAVIGLGLGLQVFALERVPLSIAQPIQLAGVALLVVASTAVLGERAAPREWAGLTVLAVSLGLVCLSIQPSQDKVGTTDHDGSLFLLALISMIVGLAICAFAMRGERAAPEVLYGAGAGLMYGVAGLQTKAVSVFLTDHGAGFIARTLDSPFPYVYVIASGAGLLLYQTGLQRGRASIVVPIATVVGNVYTVVVGTVAFGEPLPADPVRLALRLGGFVVAIVVVVVLPRQERMATAAQ